MNLSLCMIVKDEAQVLPRCLASVQGLVDEMIVVDTGSTDTTPEVAGQYGARVVEYSWTDDFAAARNRSLDLAQGRWILVLDADEELPEEMRPVVSRLIQDKTVDGYLTQILNYVGPSPGREIEYSVNLRLFQNRPGYRYTGRLHEQIGENILKVNPSGHLVYGGLQIRHWGYLDTVMTSRKKGERNLALARAEVAACPDDPFFRFNLGLELHRAGRLAEAADELSASYLKHSPGSYWSSKLIKCFVVALIALGRRGEALAVLERQMPRYDRFTDLYFLKGVILNDEGDHTGAMGCFETCLALGPAPVPPYGGSEPALGTHKAAYALGQQYEAAGRVEEAAHAYRQAFSGKADAWLEPLRRLGGLLFEHRGVVTAAEALEQLVGPGTSTQVLLADVLVQRRRYDSALDLLIRAEPDLQADPAGAPALEAAAYLRSRCLVKLGRFEEALSTAASIPKGSPHHRAALVLQVFSLWADGREAEAKRLMRHNRLGAAFRQEVAGLFREEAEEVLAEGLRRYPDALLLREALAEVRRWEGQP